MTCHIKADIQTELYSFKTKERTGPFTKIHKMMVRTFVGSLCTLTSSIV